MNKKKLSEEFTNADFGQNLDDGEKVVITNTQTIEKKILPKEQPTIIAFEDDDFEDDDNSNEDFIKDFELPETSIGNFLLSDAVFENFEDATLTIKIKRKPDSLNDNFRKSCNSVMTYPPIRYIDSKADKLDIEERVNRECGGGHFILQGILGNKFLRSWEVSFPDLPEAHKPEPSATPPAMAIPADEMGEMVKQLMFDNFKKSLMGNSENSQVEELRKELETMRQEAKKQEIDNLKIEIEKLKTNPAQTSDLALALDFLKNNAGNDTITDKVLGVVFPDKEESGGLVDLAKYALNNQEQVKGLIGTVAGIFLPQLTPQTPVNFEAMARAKQQTAENPPPKQSVFQRKPKPKADNADNGDVEK